MPRLAVFPYESYSFERNREVRAGVPSEGGQLFDPMTGDSKVQIDVAGPATRRT